MLPVSKPTLRIFSLPHGRGGLTRNDRASRISISKCSKLETKHLPLFLFISSFSVDPYFQLKNLFFNLISDRVLNNAWESGSTLTKNPPYGYI